MLLVFFLANDEISSGVERNRGGSPDDGKGNGTWVGGRGSGRGWRIGRPSTSPHFDPLTQQSKKARSSNGVENGEPNPQR